MDERSSGISVAADDRIDRNFTQKFNAVLLRQLFTCAGGEDVGDFSAMGTGETAHVFDDTGNGHFKLTAEVEGF